MTELNKNIKWQDVNCLGLKCPLPVMRLEREIEKAIPYIRLITDDPISIVDIPLAVMKAGKKLTHQEKIGDQFHFFINNVAK